MERFERIARQAHLDRVRARANETRSKEINGEYIYHSFSLWCGCFEPNKDRSDAKAFREFIDERGITLTFFQRKYLLENYFGYKYHWKEEEQKWEIKRREQ